MAFFIALLGQAGSGGAQMILTIDKALEIAMDKSPTIQHSRMNLERSRESLNAQNAALKSNFTLRLNPFTRNSNRLFDSRFSDWYTTSNKGSGGTFTISQPIVQTDGTFSITNQLNWQESFSEVANPKTNTSFNNSLSMNFQQPIFTYNRTKLSLRSLELDIENTSIQNALQMLSLERSVKQAFYGVYQDKASLDITREEFTNQEKSFEIIKNKVDAGLSAKEELYQAELNLASSRASLENRQVALESSLESFKQLLGLSLDEQIIIQTDITYQPVEVSLERAIDHALKTRMELRQRLISIETAMNSIITTSAQNEFKGAITLSLGLIGTDEKFGDVYSKPTNKQTIGLSLDIPLWDWGEKKSRIKAAQINLKSSELSLEESKTDIILAIRQAYRSLNNMVSQIEIARQNIVNAERTYDINLERYKNGELTSMDLNLYQTQLSQKKMSLTDSQINYKLGLLNMKIITLWDFEKNAPVVPDMGTAILQSAQK
jgi:outer membrane protein TolC